jgi:outer membrane lipoprotein carrier protein
MPHPLGLLTARLCLVLTAGVALAANAAQAGMPATRVAQAGGQPAAASPAPGTAAALEQFLARSDALTADFRQLLLREDGSVAEESSGRFYVSRPGRFRWEYVAPSEQLVVSDGERLWMYDADLEQVTVRNVDDGLAGTPAMLLSGQGRLADSFEFGASYPQDGLDWIELKPAGARAEFKGLRVGLREGVIGAMEVIDNLEQVTRIEFSDVRLGGELDEALFRFEPPPGADVIGLEGL